VPLFRVGVSNAMTGRAGEIMVEAFDRGEARNIAASRGYRSTSVEPMGDTETADVSDVIRKPAPIERIPPEGGVTVMKIALGVFLGLTMFTFISCVGGGRVYIG
jgi:hypothetical protein